MSGYVPLFASLTTGTLCGRWPDVGLWPIVLSLTNRHGVVDVTPDYLSLVTGLSISEITACMSRFCQPDLRSRSNEEGGARLVLIEPEKRDWGWRVVNHAKYREKARKAAYDATRTASGADASRKRTERNAAADILTNNPDEPRDVPTCPDDFREVPLSDTNANKNTKNCRPQKRTPDVPHFHREVIDAYEQILPRSPRVKVWTKKRARDFEARIQERCAAGMPADSINYWQKFFEKVGASDFLTGRTGNWRSANLEWLISEANFTKVIEGSYDNRDRGDGVESA